MLYIHIILFYVTFKILYTLVLILNFTRAEEILSIFLTPVGSGKKTQS